jgi:hypothetical protein
LVWRKRKIIVILIIFIDPCVVDNHRGRGWCGWGSMARGSRSMQIPNAHSRHEVAASSLVEGAMGRLVAVLRINDRRSWGTSTAHSDIKLVILLVVTAHLGEASNNVGSAQGYPSCWVCEIRAVHTLLSGETVPRNLSIRWTDRLITIGYRVKVSSAPREWVKYLRNENLRSVQ